MAGHDIVPEERVHVTPLGVDVAAFAPAADEAVDGVRRKYGIDGPYALFVGGIEPRKNLDTWCTRSRRSNRARDSSIAGGPVRWDPKAADRLAEGSGPLPPAARARIVRTGYATIGRRLRLLTGATLLAYPSLHEGFGFPRARKGSRQACRSSHRTCPRSPRSRATRRSRSIPRDPAAIADGLAQLFGDPDLRAMLAAAGLARAAKFTWEACAKRTAAALHAAHDVARG